MRATISIGVIWCAGGIPSGVTPALAERANRETFGYPNAPQASGFNQGKELWVGLEDHVLGYARTYRHRISVFTGPVLNPVDPVYRGIAIPRLFWKVAAWSAVIADEPRLRSTGFILDQAPALGDLGLPTRPETPPPLGPFHTPGCGGRYHRADRAQPVDSGDLRHPQPADRCRRSITLGSPQAPPRHSLVSTYLG